MKYYKAGSFLECMSASDMDFDLQVPKYKCSACGQNYITNWFNYPRLNPREILNKNEIERLGPLIKVKSSSEEIEGIVEKLQTHYRVPIAAGTIFGPTKLTITAKPKWDFFVLPGRAGVFIRRGAIEALLSADKIEFDFVSTPTKGKYAQEADFVEIAVKVEGRAKLPNNYTFCGKCFRFSPGESFNTPLIKSSIPSDTLIFKTLETGAIVLSSLLVDAAERLKLTGLIKGKTIFEAEVV